MVAAVVAMSANIDANAQINLKGVLKNAAGQVTKKDSYHAAEEAADARAKAQNEAAKKFFESNNTSASEPQTQAVPDKYDPEYNYKPSAEAVAADAKASSSSVWEGFTKSQAQIAGAFENLPAKAFPIKPYFEAPTLYYDGGASKSESYNLETIDLVVSKVAKSYGAYIKDWDWSKVEQLPNGETGYLPRREVASSYFCSAFAADPCSPKAFSQWAAAFMLDQHPTIRGAYEIGMQDPANNFVANVNGSPLMSMYSAAEIKNFWFERDELCTELAIKVTPWSVVEEFLVNLGDAIVAADKEGDALAVFKDKLIFDSIYKEVAEKHYHFARSNALSLAKHNVDQYNIANLAENIQAANRAPVNMPAAVSMDASFVKALENAAREAYGDKVVKAYFTSNDWHIFKNPNFPYEVKHRSVNAVIIVQEGGKYYMYQRAFLQNYNGSAYTNNFAIQAPMPDPGKLPVNYK